MLICSCFRTGECRNLFEISLIINSEENTWRNTKDTIEVPRNIEVMNSEAAVSIDKDRDVLLL